MAQFNEAEMKIRPSLSKKGARRSNRRENRAQRNSDGKKSARTWGDRGALLLNALLFSSI
jgi:hypothetical protein